MGKVVEVVRASTSSQTQDESESATFSFYVLLVERCRTREGKA